MPQVITMYFYLFVGSMNQDCMEVHLQPSPQLRRSLDGSFSQAGDTPMASEDFHPKRPCPLSGSSCCSGSSVSPCGPVHVDSPVKETGVLLERHSPSTPADQGIIEVPISTTPRIQRLKWANGKPNRREGKRRRLTFPLPDEQSTCPRDPPPVQKSCPISKTATTCDVDREERLIASMDRLSDTVDRFMTFCGDGLVSASSQLMAPSLQAMEKQQQFIQSLMTSLNRVTGRMGAAVKNFNEIPTTASEQPPPPVFSFGSQPVAAATVVNNQQSQITTDAAPNGQEGLWQGHQRSQGKGRRRKRRGAHRNILDKFN